MQAWNGVQYDDEVEWVSGNCTCHGTSSACTACPGPSWSGLWSPGLLTCLLICLLNCPWRVQKKATAKFKASMLKILSMLNDPSVTWDVGESLVQPVV